MNEVLQVLLIGIFSLLVIASIVGLAIRKNVKSDEGRKTAQNLVDRIKAWWVMCIIFFISLYVGQLGSVVLFFLSSIFALREFMTLTPTNPTDHRVLFWIFFVFTPVQYYLVATQWYGLFSILIPVYGFLFLPLRSALSGDCENFLERSAKIQWGLMICVYCISHVPGLVMLDIPGYQSNSLLIFYLIFVTQASDIFQYIFGKILGKRKIAPLVSPNKTWEGFIGGTVVATVFGAGLYWITPFNPIQALVISFLVCILGFSGGLVMSAIKRDRGVKDYGQSIPGHGGTLDRIDSICFSAPIFFHVIRYFFTV